MARGKAKGSVKAANDKEKDKDKKDDTCAIFLVDPKKCLDLSNKRVDWVYCEGCSYSDGWFHCPCVKVDGKKAAEPDFIFHCEICKPIRIKVCQIKYSLIGNYILSLKYLLIFVTIYSSSGV